MTDNTQTEALLPSRETLMAQAQVFASAWAIAGSRFDSGDGMEVAEQEKAILADMTRRLHARIAELEAQLESIRAGGVNSPLMGQPHSGPHRAVQLVEASTAGFTAADMATAKAQGFRDGAASAMAGEPMAWMTFTEEGDPDMVFLDRLDACQYCEDDDPPKPLYLAAPPTAQAEGWTRLPGALPEPGTPVLLDIGKKYPIRAMWAAKHTVQAADDDTDWGEYVEEDDMYYAPEGWYEWNQCEDNHWRVPETPRAWMPLPPTSAEGVEHG